MANIKNQMGQKEKKKCLFVQIQPTLILEILKKVFIFIFIVFKILLYKRIPTLMLVNPEKIILTL